MNYEIARNIELEAKNIELTHQLRELQEKLNSCKQP